MLRFEFPCRGSLPPFCLPGDLSTIRKTVPPCNAYHKDRTTLLHVRASLRVPVSRISASRHLPRFRVWGAPPAAAAAAAVRSARSVGCGYTDVAGRVQETYLTKAVHQGRCGVEFFEQGTSTAYKYRYRAKRSSHLFPRECTTRRLQGTRLSYPFTAYLHYAAFESSQYSLGTIALTSHEELASNWYLLTTTP